MISPSDTPILSKIVQFSKVLERRISNSRLETAHLGQASIPFVETCTTKQISSHTKNYIQQSVFFLHLNRILSKDI